MNRPDDVVGARSSRTNNAGGSPSTGFEFVPSLADPRLPDASESKRGCAPLAIASEPMGFVEFAVRLTKRCDRHEAAVLRRQPGAPARRRRIGDVGAGVARRRPSAPSIPHRMNSSSRLSSWPRRTTGASLSGKTARLPCQSPSRSHSRSTLEQAPQYLLRRRH